MADQLSKLIEHQKVFMIDAHGQEENPNVRERLYDDTKYDLHFHKITNPISINGKKECTAEIRIPVNNPNREISIEINDNDEDSIPRKLKKEIKEALKDKSTRENFVKELEKIMATYPSTKNNREKTEDALQHFANAFGINTVAIRDRWFTHIDQDKNNVSMFSVISTNNERYNFLTSNNFMFAEQAEPSKKIIITLMGLAQRGKTETITLAFQHLLDKYPQHAIIIDDGKISGDIKAILFINGAKVGIESQGDPNSRQGRSIDEFVRMGCDVILVAGRTRGMTRKSITNYKDTHKIISYHKYHTKYKEMYHQVNDEIARSLTHLVEYCIAESFEEL